MEEKNEILEIKKQNDDNQSEKNEATIFSIVFKELCFFCFVYVLGYAILVTRFNNTKVVLFALLVIFVSNALFIIKRNKDFKIISILYSICISICIIAVIDKRAGAVHLTAFIIAFCIATISNLVLKHLRWKKED
jgi:CDP-diglyceride synthetase